MKSKPPDLGPVSRTSDEEKLWSAADLLHPARRMTGLRIADLFALSDVSEVLDYLRRIDRSARLVIGGNLAEESLDRNRLERLRTSVTNQARQARELQESLDQKGAGSILQDELENLIGYFDNALGEIGRQLRRFQ